MEAETDENVGGLDRFALPSSTEIDFIKDATIKDVNGVLTYLMTIKAPNALSLSLQFSEFNLSENSILSIYTRYKLTDSITAKENNNGRIWATRVYQGNILNLVLKLPSTEKGRTSLKIGRVLFGFKKFGIAAQFGNVGASATCMRNVACPEGNNWSIEKNAVA
jgi:hypothetical protein